MPRPRRVSARTGTPPPALIPLHSLVSQQLVALLNDDPEFRDTALEVGMIDQRWLDDPAGRPLATAPPNEVVRRFVERAAERKPSVLTRLGLNAMQVLSAGPAPTADERQSTITVVFTDLEGFTSFTAQQGDAAAISLLAEHHRTVSPVVRRFGGQIVKRLGDGLMLTFSDPAYAVRAAVELVGMPPDELRLRAGVHTGSAVVSRDDVVGHAVNVAARITDQADGGQVLVSDAAVVAAGEITGVSLGEAVHQTLKGVPEPVAVHPATAVG